MTALITVRDASKTYTEGGVTVSALRGVDMDVHAGEMVALAGPSGSGKTTLLSIMGCILKATSGSIQIAGREVAGLPESRLPDIRLAHIGFVFQGFNLFPTLKAGENIELILGLKGFEARQARKLAHELLERVGLADKFNTLPANLSGGQKQRVAIARAIAGDPKIILADEPTAALDSHTGHTVIKMMRALAHERGRAVVIVTHDPRVLPLADRTVRIEDGLIAMPQTAAPVEPLSQNAPTIVTAGLFYSSQVQVQ
jgi:putative ABC transport system ATP-binding protein